MERVRSKMQTGKQVKESENFVYRYFSYRVRIYWLPHCALQQVHLRSIRRDQRVQSISSHLLYVISMCSTTELPCSLYLYVLLELSSLTHYSPAPPILCQLTRTVIPRPFVMRTSSYIQLVQSCLLPANRLDISALMQLVCRYLLREFAHVHRVGQIIVQHENVLSFVFVSGILSGMWTCTQRLIVLHIQVIVLHSQGDLCNLFQ